MNKLEYEIIDVLKELKQEYGLIEVKAEFEAEGSRLDELSRLKDVTSKVGLPLIIKIGGVEAVTDLFMGLTLGAKWIIAPMAETPFALSKFVDTLETLVPKDNDTEFAWNMETITAFTHLDEMLAIRNGGRLTGVTVGRVDLTGSMGKNRKSVDGDEIFDICRTTFIKARAKGLHTGLGGAISTDSIPFIKALNREKLLDKYETRKAVFQADAIEKAEDGILTAIKFELLWLKSKRRHYGGIKAEDETRIAMLEKRLNG